MAIRFYDEALVNKIANWVKDPNLVILKPNEVTELFQIRADKQNDKPLSLPLISIAREPEVEILSINKKALSFDGKKVSSSKTNTITLGAVPIQINYQLDIYTRYYEEGDEYLRNFIFNFINHPKLSVLVPYNDVGLSHNANIQIVSTVSDNSDIPQRLFSGQFTRWTIKLIIDDAYLFSVPIKTNKTIEGFLEQNS